MKIANSPLYLWLNVKISSLYLKYSLNNNSVTTEDRILIRHYRLDKSIEPKNMPPNNPDLNPADYSILENLLQRLYKHQRIRDMQHLKVLLEEKRDELPQYESDACINQFRYRLLKVIEVAGKHILNIFF